ncbi:major facilitator superfamily domain-containing protein [Mycena maculata]|uniref:Major facilitator superfamily domain-containing protein n=1 Tax=Mycena maculata TaxID=230809 RepID=A0AAD7K484_9AGAR|nr:major facilitator superfamily domain-containing protein [Mycena maculata]
MAPHHGAPIPPFKHTDVDHRPDDQENPQNWTDGWKWLITLTCVIMTVNVTFVSSAPSSVTAAIMEAFDVKAKISNLIMSTFLLGYVHYSGGSGSEVIGRRPIFLIMMTAYTILHLGQALAKNIETLWITRFLGSFFAVTPLVNAGVMGPIIAGYIVDSKLSWRWIFWVMMIFVGSCTLVMMVALPETYTPVLLPKKVCARRAADPAGAQHLYTMPRGVLHRTLFRPFLMLVGEPILVFITLYLSLVYGIMYCHPSPVSSPTILQTQVADWHGTVFKVFPIIFIEKHGFIIAQDRLTWCGFPPLEECLQGGMVGGCTFVVGIFWLAWMGQYLSVLWYEPAISTVLVELSISSIFVSFLVETSLMYSASAFTANTFCRSLVMLTKLGMNWAVTLLGGVGLLLAPMPFLFYQYGMHVHARSKFAPCVDLKIMKLLEEEKMAYEKTV